MSEDLKQVIEEIEDETEEEKKDRLIKAMKERIAAQEKSVVQK